MEFLIWKEERGGGGEPEGRERARLGSSLERPPGISFLEREGGKDRLGYFRLC
jgi:hypothetical protein